MPVTKVKSNACEKVSRVHGELLLGKFDVEDLVVCFNKLGIKLELDEAKKLVEK